jgi:hypothetical protein
MKRRNGSTSPVAPVPPPAPRADVQVTRMKRCRCGCTPLAHRGAKGTGACLLCDCEAFREHTP